MIGDPNRVSINAVEFRHYKALERFTLRLQHTNILVGPNNCGKSTIIGAFRVLSVALRRARSRKPERVKAPDGIRNGYVVPGDHLPVSMENIHTNYADVDTTVCFRLSNGNELLLFFPSEGECYLIPITRGPQVNTVAAFKRDFPITLGIIPVLGPLEEEETLLEEETVRRALATPRAARQFRNFWLHNPDEFDAFARMIARTWSGMEVDRPRRLDLSPRITMFCRENRMTREIFWAGFGFQIWCQLITHIVRSRGNSLIVVDEPEVYLHPDVQRQLLAILREIGPDVLVATHSTEIMAEADASEIVLIDKNRLNSQRLKDIEGVQAALDAVGSLQNITLTRLARNKKLLFVEGDSDYRLIRRFAKKLGLSELASGVDLTGIESGGFHTHDQIASYAWGIEKTMKGASLHIAAVFDRDFWCEEEIHEISKNLADRIDFVHFHSRKEIENYLLIPEALQHALELALRDQSVRSGNVPTEVPDVRVLLEEITNAMRHDVLGQYVAKRLKFLGGGGQDPATIMGETTRGFDVKWGCLETRLEIVPGKEVLRALRGSISESTGLTLTDARIVECIKKEQIPEDLRLLLNGLEHFRIGFEK